VLLCCHCPIGNHASVLSNRTNILVKSTAYISDDPKIRSSHYRADMCWIHGYSLYFGFLIIAGLILLHNIAMVVHVSKTLIMKKTEVGIYCK